MTRLLRENVVDGAGFAAEEGGSTPPVRRELGLADDLLDAVLGQILIEAPAPGTSAHASSAVAPRALAPQLVALTDAERPLMADWLDRIIESG